MASTADRSRDRSRQAGADPRDRRSPHPPPSPSPAASLERALGDPLDDRRPGSFRASVRADREEEFPEELCAAAFALGVADHLVPEEYGGRLRSLEECFALSRVLSRRDLTAAVAVGANLLAALPVWLRGTEGQRRTVADLLRRRAFLSFALSEREHGADIAASGVTARATRGGRRVDGVKWLINNAGHASAATVAARTGEGFRGLTVFLLVRARETEDGQWSALPGIPTHGLRGSAFGGLAFSGFPARETDVVGRTGEGLELLLKTLQITRVLVGSFALGALDTCLRATLAFARSRRLYGAPIAELDSVARRLADAYTDLLVGETVALGACRAAHLAPDRLPLMSACVKYLVPQTAVDGIESLAVVLGARSYVAGEHWHGIFEKMRRDCAVTQLFDGSSPVVRAAIVDQLPTVMRTWREERARETAGGRAVETAGGAPPAPPALYAPAPPPTAWIDEAEFDLQTDADETLRGIDAAYEAVRDEAVRDGATDGAGRESAGGAGHESGAGQRSAAYRGRLPELLELLEWYRAETARLAAEVARNEHDPDWRRSGAAYDLAARYSHLHAAGACAWRWLARRPDPPDAFVGDGTWLLLCLRRLAARIGRERPAFDDVDRAALARLERAYDDGLPFSGLDTPSSPHRSDSEMM